MLKRTHAGCYSLFPRMLFPEVSPVGDTINYCSIGKDHPSPEEPSPHHPHRHSQPEPPGRELVSLAECLKTAGVLPWTRQAFGTVSEQTETQCRPAWGRANRKALEQRSLIPAIPLRCHPSLGRLPNRCEPQCLHM